MDIAADAATLKDMMLIRKLQSCVFIACVGVAAMGCVDNTPDNESSTTATEELDENECGVASNSHTVLIRQISFAPEIEAGVTRGLDLDGRVSDRDDDATCGKVDFESPDGLEGVDNQFARLLPLIDAAASLDSVEALIARTLNSGGLSLALQMERLDDFENDSCVEVSILSAEGAPRIGANGLIEAGQTLDVDPQTEAVAIDSASVEQGHLTAGPIDLHVPLTVDTFDVPLTIRNAIISADLDADGHLRGIIAGAIVVPEVVEEITQIDASGDLLDLVARILEREADLAQNDDDECEHLSVTLDFEAAPIFFFED